MVHGQVVQLVPRRVCPVLGRKRGVGHVRQPCPAASSAHEPRHGGQKHEKQQDAAELPEASGDAIAKEFEQFLRRRRETD